MAQSKAPDYVILGAGVVGLTTALELKDRYPESEVVIVAKFVPGDRSIEYTSPWAGANWMSAVCFSFLKSSSLFGLFFIVCCIKVFEIVF